MAKKSYSVAQARSHLPTILNEVGAGDEIYLTRRGQPAAVVVSTKVYDALRGARATFEEAYGAFLRRHAREDLDLDPKDVDALRDHSPGRKVRL
jgi:prevent-host-death family protein